MATPKDFKRAEIIAKGKVQKVAYRDAVDDIAIKLDIKGFVENIKPRNVRIIAEGKEENIKEFIKEIKIKRFPINVEEIEVEFKPSTGEFEYFEIRRSDWKEELGERFDVAGTLLYGSIDLQRESISLQKESLKKHDETIGILKEMKGTQEQMKGTQEQMKGTQEEMKVTQEEMKGTQEQMNRKLGIIADNTEEIKSNTSQYKVMHEEIMRLKEDMMQVKKALALV